MEKNTIRRKRDLLLEVQQKQQAAEEHKRQQAMAAIGDLKPRHGLCCTSADIDQLCQIYKTNLGQKLVLSKKSPLL